MTAYAFTLTGARLLALPSGALLWPDQRLLVVSDLHFGKALRLARRGGALLPPWEVAETLARLEADLQAHAPAQVIALGDSFDDPQAEAELDAAHRLRLARMADGRDWVWIAGNHDPGPLTLPGRQLAEAQIGPLTFSHIAQPGTVAEVSGHYHPKARLAGRWRPCFLLDAARVILPAYGTFTGGLACSAPELLALFQPTALAVLTGTRALAVPMASAGR